MTIAEFLLARIAEDEEGPFLNAWHVGRVRAECEAKRRIVELHDDPEWDRCTSADHMGVLFTADECPILRALGSVYADHPDFRDEWRL